MDDALAGLVGFALIATISPGGATSLVTAAGARFGYLGSLPLIFGIATALALLAGSAGSGLAALIVAVPSIGFAIKLIGTIYLLVLAVKIGASGKPGIDDAQGTPALGFFGGALLLIVNPKAWAMALGVAGSFANLVQSPFYLSLLFAATFAACAILSLSLWAIAGSYLAPRVKHERAWRVINVVLAVMLIASIISFWR